MPSSRLGPGKNNSSIEYKKRGNPNRSDLRKYVIKKSAENLKMLNRIKKRIINLERQLSHALRSKRDYEKRLGIEKNNNSNSIRRRVNIETGPNNNNYNFNYNARRRLGI